MNERRWDRITAAAGIASALLLIGQLATWANPHYNEPLEKITDYYVKNRATALASIDIWMLGMVALLVLAAGLRSILRRADSERDVLPMLAFGGAVAMLCIGTVFNTMNGALGLFAGQASEREIRLLMAVDNAADNFQFLPLGIFLGAISLAMLRGRVFAHWLGWLGVVGGLLLVLGSTGVMTVDDPSMGDLGMLGLMLYLIWAVAVSVRLLRRPAVATAPRKTPVRGSVPA
jgi:hypothetical protein